MRKMVKEAKAQGYRSIHSYVMCLVCDYLREQDLYEDVDAAHSYKEGKVRAVTRTKYRCTPNHLRNVKRAAKFNDFSNYPAWIRGLIRDDING